MTTKQKANALKALAIAHKELQIAQGNIGSEFMITKDLVTETMQEIYTIMQSVETMACSQ